MKVTKKDFIVLAISIMINLILPQIVKPMATKGQIKPPDGAAKLPFFDQLVHMLVHHAQVPWSSSLIVGVIVFLSIILSKLMVKK